MKRLLPLLLCLLAFTFRAPGQNPAAGDTGSVKLSLVGGDTITGKVSGVQDGQVSVVTDYGAIRVPIAKLTEASKKTLGIQGETNVAQLQKKVSDLEVLVEKLRTENAQLRRQMTAAPTGGATGIQPLTGGTSVKPSPGGTAPKNGGYWISSTGKRHNANCRYYATSKGRGGSATEGVACKICGG